MEHFGCYICRVLQFWGFWCLCQHTSERSGMSETAEWCGCDKDCILNMGNEVVKPYKIITKGEVVSSVVTGSLNDNFLLLENKGVTAWHWNILCVWCRDCLGYTYSQGSNVTLCGGSVLQLSTFSSKIRIKTSALAKCISQQRLSFSLFAFFWNIHALVKSLNLI